MAKNIDRRNFIKAATGLAGLVLTGCATTQNLGRFAPENMVTDLGLARISEQDTPFYLGGYILYDVPYYLFLEKKVGDNQLPISYIPVLETSRILNFKGEKIGIEGGRKFIPTKQKSLKNEDKFATRIPIQSEDDPITCVRGLKGKKFSWNGSQSPASTFNLTNQTEGEEFYISTLKINYKGKIDLELLYPHVHNSRTDEKGFLPFYNLKKESTYLHKNEKTGQISFVNENGIYRPKFQNSLNNQPIYTPGMQEAESYRLGGDNTWEYQLNSKGNWMAKKIEGKNEQWRDFSTLPREKATEATNKLNKAFNK